jgi:RNA polymerase I-specific transcription initiation factor RRN3
MYILCFRMRSLMDIPRLKIRLIKMPMELIWKHKLNPLKVNEHFTMFDCGFYG